MAQNGNLLEISGLRTHFFSREGTLRALEDVNFVVRRGEILGVIGESGCGKSVTAQSVLRIVPSNGSIVSGEILLRNHGRTVDLTTLDPRGPQIRAIRGAEISMVFQEPMTSFSPVYTIGNQIAEVVELHQRCTYAEARERTIEMLRRVGMPKAEQQVDAYPFTLSGGMRQRAMIAMALSCRPTLLIADEPTSAVDVTIQAQILDLLDSLQKEMDMSIMLITHDLGVVAETADHLLIMYLGRNVEYGTTETLFYEPKHPYTQGLLASVPKLGMIGDRELMPIEGTVPSLYEIPQGCAFHPRCPHMIAGVCDKQVPPLVELETEHTVRCWLYTEPDAEQTDG
jgi:peptide/nickel transport system ATP-binding protein